MIGAHVQNLTAGQGTTTDANGLFNMPVQPGDTLLISHVGYQRLGWVASENWLREDVVEFFLPIDTIYLREVVIGVLPEYERFKQLIIETQPEDTFEIFGYAQIDFASLPPIVTDEDVQGELTLIGVAFDPEGLTKKGREKRKFEKMMDRKGTVDKANSKFTREWVAEATKLSGDQLTSFIAYCKFTPEYLAETTMYLIHEKMMVLLDDFMSEQSEG